MATSPRVRNADLEKISLAHEELDLRLVYDLTRVTRNTSHFAETGVRLLNPFSIDAPAAPSDK